MSKVFWFAILVALAALLACGSEEPAAEPTATPAPPTTAAPTATPEPTPTPTATPRPTNTPAPTATPEPSPAPGARVISPLSLDDPSAFISGISERELDCIGRRIDPARLPIVISGSEQATEIEMVNFIQCLWDETLLRLFLGGLVMDIGSLSPESSACIRSGISDIDIRSMMLAGATGSDEGESIVAFDLTISCLNDEERAMVSSSLGPSEEMQCLMQELGGPEEAEAALRLSEEQGPSFALIVAAVECGLSESDLAALTTTAPVGAVPTPGDSVSVIVPLNIEDPVALMSELSATEQSCISANVDPQQLAAMLSGSEIAPDEAGEVYQCLEDETLLRLFVTGLIGLTEPLSAESSACIREGMEGIDPRSVMSAGAEGDPGAAMVGSMAAYMTTLSCLNDEEWQAASAATGMDPGERENLQCVMKELGGPEGMAEALSSEDGSGFIVILTAAFTCGLQMEGMAPGG